MVKDLRLSAVIWKEEHGYTALCPQLDVASQGKTKAEAGKNLKEAVELYLDEKRKIKRLFPATFTNFSVRLS
ncbi:Uncharacterised protein [Candidatus Gugararchaeum adminiculabundum]|nr:Uncharacterised protein [Candidatus Gugararchaeum adminiculabundum]